MSEPKLLLDVIGRDGGRSEVEAQIYPRAVLTLDENGTVQTTKAAYLGAKFLDFQLTVGSSYDLDTATYNRFLLHLTENVSITQTGLIAGAHVEAVLHNITGAAISLTFPGTWRWAGGRGTPSALASGKSGILNLRGILSGLSVVVLASWDPENFTD